MPRQFPTPKKGITKRSIVEFCCSSESRLGNAKFAGDCEVTRITEKDDARTRKGRRRTVHACQDESTYALLWSSIPCTGGSPWQRMNMHRLGRDHLRKVLREVADAGQMIDNVISAARANRKAGGGTRHRVAIRLHILE